MSELVHFVTRQGRRIAVRVRTGRGPTLIFLPGYMSDMAGTKAEALDHWAASRGRSMLRFDYGGCGQSDGAFEGQTLLDWRDDALAMIDEVASGPVLLVGSSMGGWLMLLAALARPERVAGLVGIAPAPDFTDWGFNPGQKRLIQESGKLVEHSPYGDAPTVTTRAFWESGEASKLLDAQIDLDCPVRLLHGLADEDVPWRISLKLMERLRSADVQALLIKDGNHRLSREGDIALLIAAVEGLMERL